ncbi:MAG: plasmid pRiA4b ORF-3 family protein [Deltaproteobacteria bacterium]|jgi:hypothetical protein|nr:plasmid pRiA4b ORF-3 family protein [Deltaproteobacteria bacterium]
MNADLKPARGGQAFRLDSALSSQGQGLSFLSDFCRLDLFTAVIAGKDKQAGCNLKTPSVARKKSSRNVPFFSFRIELLHIAPEVWREFYVPSDISLARLHLVIQYVMGWENCHLFSFDIRGDTYDIGDDYKNFLLTGNERYTPLSTIKLNVLRISTRTRIRYLYDMGDCWLHVIKLLDRNYVPETPKQKCGCIAGKGACPPEECGGASGYDQLLEIQADPAHYDPEERWDEDDPIDPEAFDIELINSRLSSL